MGAKDSKPVFLTYEEAVRRVTDAELKRLKDAFKHSPTLGGYMSKANFLREVLGDGVPTRMAGQMYRAFGGTPKGLGFKDLVCGLVLLTRGYQEEKVKFLFGLYAHESLTYVQKEDMDDLVLSTEGQVPHELSILFKETDRVSYEMFSEWVLVYPQATSVSRWLLKEPCSVTLSNDLETPTFFQTLAGVTHLEETDIIELENRYWPLKAQSRSGRFDFETFKLAVYPNLPESLIDGVFTAFDENRDGHIDFKEMACGISACCRGPVAERQKFCFKVFDKDHDGLLSRQELEDMVEAMLLIRNQTKAPHLEVDKSVTPQSLAGEILNEYDADKDGFITQEEYLVWTVAHYLPNNCLSLLFQICHVVLGLKPLSREDEGQVILGWLEREDFKGMQANQTLYLVAMAWWKQWLDYVLYTTPSPFHEHNSLNNNNCRAEPGKSNHSRGLVFCPNLSRKATLHANDNDPPQVFGTGYTTLPHSNHSSATSSPTKFATMPRSNTPTNSALRCNRSSFEVSSNNLAYTSSPAHSTSSTPNASPRPGKKLFGMSFHKPGAIDNSPLIVPNSQKVMTLTNEGGRLKRDRMLARGRDFELLPEPVWKALSTWYGGTPALPRNVIAPSSGGPPELELYPICVKLLRHQLPTQRPNQATTFTGMMSGIGGMVINSTNFASSQPQTPRRYQAYTSTFSRKHTLKQVYEFLAARLRIAREDMRLWKFKDEQNMTLLEDEENNMEELEIEENTQILIEVRNKDLTWPEEMSQLAKNRAVVDKNLQVPTERGATGLNNLGNTCFMNTALQCMSNTKILTLYFNGGMHLYELNRANPLGMKGHIAQRYGELVKDLWSGTMKNIAPLKLRWTIGKYAPRFNGFQQHDAQELMAFLLDGLHEDLNRVHHKPYVELKDSDGRLDEVVAKEAWDNHMVRNRSVVVDLFHGQLKSCVRCLECSHTSVRFDPFTFLSLPLPMDSCIHLEVIVVGLDGAIPTKYGLRLNMDEKYQGLKKQLNDLSGIPTGQILLAETFNAVIKSFPQDNQKIKSLAGNLYAYELPPGDHIPPMTAQEERASSPCKVATGLGHIQRMHTKQNMQKEHLAVVNGSDSSLDVGDIGNHDSLESVQSTSNSSSVALHVNGLTSSNPVSGSVLYRNPNNSNQATPATVIENFIGFVVGVHRKMIRMDLYFLSSQKTRPSLFGTPLIIPCDDVTTHQDLYQHVWTQVSRLVSPLPPSEVATPNHAQDCDDSLGYEYPFTLKVVQKDGFTCAWCPWYRFCRGCKLDCTEEFFNHGSSFIAVDWEATAVHLRYQTSHEKVYKDHLSVEESRRLQTEPIDLDTCLKAFTEEEELGEKELYYCSKCKQHRLAAKKLEIWRLPSILIIHLKRFQFLNGRWVKSQKIVKFPLREFDPRNYLAPRTNGGINSDYLNGSKLTNANESTNHDTTLANEIDRKTKISANGDAISVINGTIGNGVLSQPSLESVSAGTPNDKGDGKTGDKQSVKPAKPVCSEGVKLQTCNSESDGSNESCNENYSNVRYNLYSMCCHTGILGGGHYVAYAKNPNDRWYCYNDSSCKEVFPENLDTNSAYMLFFEQEALDEEKFMPNLKGRVPDTQDIDDEFDSDLRKNCSIQ